MKSKLYFLVMFILFFALFALLNFASIGGAIYPFAFAMLFALAWANQKVWLLAPAYIGAALAVNFSFESAIGSVVCALFLVVPYYIHILLKKNIKKWELLIYCILSQTATVVFQALGGVSPFIIVASLIGGGLFFWACCHIFEPIIIRGFAFKLTSGELICGAIVLMALSDGLYSCDLYGFSFLKLFVTFALLSISYTSKSAYTCLISAVLALGTLVHENNPVYVTPIILWALSIVAFKTQKRIFPVLAVIACEAVVGFYFKLYYSFGILEFAPVIAGALIFFLLPKKWYDKVSVLLSTNNDRMAVKNVVNRNREVLKRRLDNLSEVFLDMNEVFKKLIKESLSPSQVQELLFEEVKGSVCKNCPEAKHCHRTFCGETKKMFCELIKISMDRGRITLLDLPSYLTSRCGRVNNLMSEINTLTNQYKNYQSLVSNVDISKMLISDQLGGIAQIMRSLSNEVDSLISFNSAQESKIIDELSYNNIFCSDAVVYDKDARTVMASLVVRAEDASRPRLAQVVSKVCSCPMAVYEAYPSSRSGLVNINLKTAPRYDAVFGVAIHRKTGSNISGDCHSIIKLDGDKFLFAICDGMGSGEKANEKSDTTIGLIENFYKAGFDNELILSSVNKLLNLEKDDVFSTIDVCVVDLKNGIADCIKMGAPSSFVKGEEECKIIEGGALPVGVLQEGKAQIKKIVLCEKDMIVLTSDGINDSFGSDSEMKDFLCTLKTTNPQEFANALLDKALANNNGHAVDDMTALVIKIFAN